LLQKGFPSEKFVIGAAFYARIWEGVDRKNWGLHQQGKFKQALDFKDFDALSPDSGWVHHWDMKAYAPYAYHKTKNLFVTYDNGMSISEKVMYARRQNLGGIMFWELQCDKSEQGLLHALYESVLKTR
jgi:chitinase